MRDFVRKYYNDHARISTQCTTLGVDHPLMEPYAKWVVCLTMCSYCAGVCVCIMSVCVSTCI